jgi:hypothetical protein
MTIGPQSKSYRKEKKKSNTQIQCYSMKPACRNISRLDKAYVIYQNVDVRLLCATIKVEKNLFFNFSFILRDTVSKTNLVSKVDPQPYDFLFKMRHFPTIPRYERNTMEFTFFDYSH